MEKLKILVEQGLFNDLYNAESALSYIRAISEHSKEINNSDSEITQTFAYFQRICLHEYVMSLARLYDKSSKRNKTRCIEVLITNMKEKPDIFPKTIEKYQTKLQLLSKSLPADSLMENLNNNENSKFTQKLGAILDSRMLALEDERKIIKDWRDKLLSHNDTDNKVDNINFSNSEKLLDFGWSVIELVGWAYLSIVYESNGRNNMRETARRQGAYFTRLFKKIK